jgi:hypothetical protein
VVDFKKAMAKMAKKNEATAQAAPEEKATGSGLALVQSDELAQVIGDLDLGTDGLEETDASDRRIAALAFNTNIVDAAGDPIPKNRFFDTVSEQVSSKKRLVLLTVHKSNAFTRFVDGQGTQIVCRSWDRMTGEMEDGKTRPCLNCPDKRWTQDASGKRTRNCADVANVVALDLEDAQPKVIRFKKTSHKPWKDFLNKHFLGKRIVNGKRANLPLFAVETEIGLEMVKGKSGSYATPVFDRGRTLNRDEILFFAEQSRGAREYMERVRDVADDAEKHEGEAPAADADFNPSEFSDDGAAASESSAGGNRF